MTRRKLARLTAIILISAALHRSSSDDGKSRCASKRFSNAYQARHGRYGLAKYRMGSRIGVLESLFDEGFEAVRGGCGLRGYPAPKRVQERIKAK
ncbi:hypothetical protein D3H35_16495 [Cohnella faecalis]|uniref:Uncharacterized protein n=1 Tax=Cohnella faecalis TaxID=2315694 RepID=A0A398CR66_9BACL|nr:hypothetical protein D3H35_16495 [Cohnella faecalis]